MSTQQAYDVVIVGGGLVGLCSAFYLRRPGRKIGVILGTQPGQASQAAAGMLTPTCEWSPEMPRPFLDFLQQGRACYHEFLSTLLAGLHSKETTGYAERDMLLLDLVENTTTLDSRFAGLQQAGARVSWLNRQQVCMREPSLNPEAIRGAICVTGDAVINPRALHHVLQGYLGQQQIELLDANLLCVQEQGEDFLLTLDTSHTLLPSRIIIAAGAWSCEVAALFHLSVPVAPVRGQLIQLRGLPGLLQHILYLPAGACGCLLERAPGRYLAGTSEEYLAADVCNTSKVVAAILTRINAVCLPAGDFVIDEMWSGFRPMLPDELPMISVSSDPRIIVATGHYRNGVLLSPLTGLLVRSLFDTETPALDLDPYRFHRAYPAPYRFASAY